MMHFLTAFVKQSLQPARAPVVHRSAPVQQGVPSSMQQDMSQQPTLGQGFQQPSKEVVNETIRKEENIGAHFSPAKKNDLDSPGQAVFSPTRAPVVHRSAPVQQGAPPSMQQDMSQQPTLGQGFQQPSKEVVNEIIRKEENIGAHFSPAKKNDLDSPGQAVFSPTNDSESVHRDKPLLVSGQTIGERSNLKIDEKLDTSQNSQKTEIEERLNKSNMPYLSKAEKPSLQTVEKNTQSDNAENMHSKQSRPSDEKNRNTSVNHSLEPQGNFSEDVDKAAMQKVTTGTKPIKARAEDKEKKSQAIPAHKEGISMYATVLQPVIPQQFKEAAPHTSSSEKANKEVPQVKIGHINVLVEDQAVVKPKRPNTSQDTGVRNSFGLKGL